MVLIYVKKLEAYVIIGKGPKGVSLTLVVKPIHFQVQFCCIFNFPFILSNNIHKKKFEHIMHRKVPNTKLRSF